MRRPGRRLLPEGVVKAILRPRRVAPGENLDPLDRAIEALWCRSLHEGAVLESIVRQTGFVSLLGCRNCSLAPLYLALGACVVVSSYMLGCIIVTLSIIKRDKRRAYFEEGTSLAK